MKGFEADFTKIIRDEFISHSNVPIVSTGEADFILTGRITEISWRPLTYDTTSKTVDGRTFTYETTSGRKLNIRLDMDLIERSTGNPVWSESSFQEEASFNVSADPLSSRYNQRQAIMKIAGLMAKRIYLKTMERF